METKEETTKRRCVAVLYRAKDESNYEILEPYHLLKQLVDVGDADTTIIRDLAHNQIPWGEYNKFYSKYADKKANVVYLANLFLYAYLKNPSRVTIFPASEMNIHAIQKHVTTNSTTQFFPNVEVPFEKFERRLCLEFDITQSDFQKLLSGMFTKFEGVTTQSPENIMQAAKQLNQKITFARFDLHSKQTDQWLTYKTLTRLTPVEVLKDECQCRIF